MYTYEELKEKYGELYDEQLLLERRAKTMGMEKTALHYEQAKDSGEADTTTLGQKTIAFKFVETKKAIQNFIEAKLAPKAGVKPTYTGILLELADTFKNDMEELYGILTLATLSNLLTNIVRSKELPISNISSYIGTAIEDEYNLARYLQGHKERTGEILTGIDKRVQGTYRRAYVRQLMKYDNYTVSRWNQTDRLALSCSLMFIAADTTGYFTITNRGSKGMQIVEATQYLVDLWRKNEEQIINASFRLSPTIIPPQPWESYNCGGYYGDLQDVSTFLRLHDTHNIFSKKYLKRLSQAECSQVRKAVNAIQSTPWVINIKVLEVMKQIVDLGGGRAGLPYFDQAPKPAVLPENPSEEDIKQYKEKMVEYYKSETSRRSLALRALNTINTAKDFAKYDRIWFPHNMDFRGRIYPIPSFSPQGDDLNKGLLLFADAPACHSLEDIYWLAVHGANLAGVDKVSFEDRIKWVKDNEKAILECAKDPMGCTFWQQQDEPVQFLAFCFEWQAWKEWEATHGTPEGFVTGIPVAFDGTCSGLQHFSAILRDPIGGEAVNLIPSDKPNDIYGIVAEKVNKMLDKDISSGTADVVDGDKIKYGTKSLAQIWKTYGVTRKVTKRPTMTLAYGAKEYGFRDQIMDDTIDPDIDKHRGTVDGSVFNKYNKWQASAYMAKLIWKVVGETVVKAVAGMKWLQDCAKKVAKEGQIVTWMTPMGLPVQQTYIERVAITHKLRVSGKLIRLYMPTLTGNIDKRAQSSGIAPNFIHSMDAAHLQLTVCNSVDAGIKHFAMIHDSYGAPVAQAALIFHVVRESFIQMYVENDVLKTFRENMQPFTSDELPEPPSKGTLIIEEVRNSKYIFS